MTTPRSTIRSTFAAAALIAATALSGPAFAETAEIRTGDLNLASAAGKAELARRVDAAAARVCRADTTTGSRIPNRAAARQCAQEVQHQVESRLALRNAGESFGR